jgi:hypothetical protein
MITTEPAFSNVGWLDAYIEVSNISDRTIYRRIQAPPVILGAHMRDIKNQLYGWAVGGG